MPQRIQLNEQEVIAKYKEIQSQPKVGELFGVSYGPISRILNKHNIKKNSSRKYQMDFDYFESINTPNKAYWLGFLYADGYVRKRKSSSELKLKLGKKDIGHVEKFKECLNAETPIKEEHTIVVVNGKEHHSDCCFISLSSRKLVDDLIDKGCGNKKTFTIQFPDWLDDDLIKHFIRGYFDGDGYLRSNGYSGFRINIASGSRDMLLGVGEWLKDKNIIEKYSLREQGKCSLLNIESVSARKFLQLIYDDCEMYLERKREKYLELC